MRGGIVHGELVDSGGLNVRFHCNLGDLNGRNAVGHWLFNLDRDSDVDHRLVNFDGRRDVGHSKECEGQAGEWDEGNCRDTVQSYTPSE